MDKIARVYAMESNKNCMVSERFFHGAWVWDWNRSFREGGVIVAKFLALLSSFFQVKFRDREDKWEWELGQDGVLWLVSRDVILIASCSRMV